MTGFAERLDAARDRLRDQPPNPYLTLREAAKLARCNPETVRRAFNAGQLRGFRPAHRILLREEDVRAWIESRSTLAPNPEPHPGGHSRRRRAALGSVEQLREMERQAGR